MKLLTGFESAKERSEHSDSCGFRTRGDSLTVQADAKDADINVIMDRYAKTGQVRPVARLPSYGDFDGISDYREALEAVRQAESLFMELPAKVRAKFENDPAQFVEFCEEPENRLELAEMGLLTKEATDAIRKEVEASGKNRADEGGAAAVARSDVASGHKPGKERAKGAGGDDQTT